MHAFILVDQPVWCLGFHTVKCLKHFLAEWKLHSNGTNGATLMFEKAMLIIPKHYICLTDGQHLYMFSCISLQPAITYLICLFKVVYFCKHENNRNNYCIYFDVHYHIQLLYIQCSVYLNQYILSPCVFRSDWMVGDFILLSSCSKS